MLSVYLGFAYCERWQSVVASASDSYATARVGWVAPPWHWKTASRKSLSQLRRSSDVGGNWETGTVESWSTRTTTARSKGCRRSAAPPRRIPSLKRTDYSPGLSGALEGSVAPRPPFWTPRSWSTSVGPQGGPYGPSIHLFPSKVHGPVRYWLDDGRRGFVNTTCEYYARKRSLRRGYHLAYFQCFDMLCLWPPNIYGAITHFVMVCYFFVNHASSHIDTI